MILVIILKLFLKNIAPSLGHKNLNIWKLAMNIGSQMLDWGFCGPVEPVRKLKVFFEGLFVASF